MSATFGSGEYRRERSSPTEVGTGDVVRVPLLVAVVILVDLSPSFFVVVVVTVGVILDEFLPASAVMH